MAILRIRLLLPEVQRQKKRRRGRCLVADQYWYWTGLIGNCFEWDEGRVSDLFADGRDYQTTRQIKSDFA